MKDITLKKILSLFMTVVLLLEMLPASALRASAEVECTHHPEHTADCGYRETVSEIQCDHNHDEDCYQTQCLHVPHEGCSYAAPVECNCEPDAEGNHQEGCARKDEIPCDHSCTTDSGCKTLNCEHQALPDCHTTQVKTVESPCQFVCPTCTAGIAPVDELQGDEKPACICGEGEVCAEGSVKEGCAVCAASISNCKGTAKPVACICSGSSKCTAEAYNTACPVCGVENADRSGCLGTVQTPPAECSCEGQAKCTVGTITTDCPVCNAADADLNAVCLGTEPAVCDCVLKCQETGSEACAVCEEDASLCVGKDCTCEYQCAADDADDTCPVCAEHPESCTQTQTKPECICDHACTENHKNEECPYCQEFPVCLNTTTWEQTYGTVEITLNWEDLSNEFGFRPENADNLVTLYHGETEVTGLTTDYTTAEDGTWKITISQIPVFEEQSDVPVSYTLQQKQVTAYEASESGSAALVYQPETQTYEGVALGYTLPLTDITGTISWSSQEHPTDGYYRDTYFEAKLGDKNLKDHLELTGTNTFTYTLKNVPQNAGYTLTAKAVPGFKEADQVKTVSADTQDTSFAYTRKVEMLDQGTQVALNWLDGSGSDENLHPGELELNLSYTLDGTTYTITDFTWDAAKSAYVHTWTQEEIDRLGLAQTDEEGNSKEVPPLEISDTGENSLNRILKTNALPAPEGIEWGAPVIAKLNFTPRTFADGVHVEYYEMEWFNGGYRMTPFVNVDFEVNLRIGGDSREEVLALLEQVKTSGAESIFVLEGNNGFAPVSISAEEVFSGMPSILQSDNDKVTLLYRYDTMLPAYHHETKAVMEYHAHCRIDDGWTNSQMQTNNLRVDTDADSINGSHGFDLEYNNTEVPGKGGETDAAYDGGRIILTKVGQRDYSATKIWLDDGDPETIAQRPEATYTLWRYAVGNYENASQVEVNGKYEFTLDKGENVIPVAFEDLPRYDADGYEYIYLIREKQSDSRYEKIFGVVDQQTGAVTDTLPPDYAERLDSDTSVYHTGTISNRRVDTDTHTVTKKWIAAYYQDQLKNVQVKLKIESQHINEDQSQEWILYGYETISGFDALHTTVTQTLNLPEYDHMGHKIHYRVAEAEVLEKVGTEWKSATILDNQPAAAAEEGGNATTSSFSFRLPMNDRTLAEESIEGATDFFTSTSTTVENEDGSSSTTIVNELEGETAYFIRKTWEGMDPENATFTLGQTGVDSVLQRYGSHTIPETAYPEGSNDSGWIRGVWKNGTTALPRYDEDGNVYTYMVLEADNNAYDSRYQYGELVDGTFVYGYDVDEDNTREKNAAWIHNSPIGLVRYINVRKVWLDDSANTDRAPAKFQIATTDGTVLYGPGGVLGDYIVVNEASNWWDKVNVTVFEYEGKFYTRKAFDAIEGKEATATAADCLYTGGFVVTEVSVGSAVVGATPDTPAGFRTVQSGNTRFVVMYNEPGAADTAVQHDDKLYYNKTGAVKPIQVSLAETQALMLALSEEEAAAAEDEKAFYNRDEFYTVTNLRIGTYDVTVEKTWQDDLSRIHGTNTDSDPENNGGTGEENQPSQQAEGETGVVRPEATVTLSCEEYEDSIVQQDGDNNDYITVSKVIHPEGKLPIQGAAVDGQTPAGEDAVQKLTGKEDKEILYFCNLPLYDGSGKIIHYEVNEELAEGDHKYRRFNTGIVYNDLKDGKVAVTQKFTNQPQNSYNVAFHLLWLDEFRQQQNQRPDVYLQLYKQSAGGPITRYGFKEYLWTATANEGDAWTYTFESLPEFDDKGNKITYYANIYTAADDGAQDYIDLQYGADRDTDLTEWSDTSRLTTVTEKNGSYVVALKDPTDTTIVDTADDGTVVMKQDNTFVYQIKDDLKITGRKIWDDIPVGFPTEDLPVLNFLLHNGDAKDGKVRAVVWRCENEDYTYTFNIRYVGMCDKDGNLIDLEGNPEAKTYWEALKTNYSVTDLPYGSLLPRYDEEGNLDTYVLQEEIYTSEVKGQLNKEHLSYEDGWGILDQDDEYKIINTFNQRISNQQEIRISKSWMQKNGVLPDAFEFPEKATFRLYRFYYDVNGHEYSGLEGRKELPGGTVVNTPYIKEVTLTRAELQEAVKDNNSSLEKTFGKQWIYAPNGTKYIYFIEEVELNGYEPEFTTTGVTEHSKKTDKGWPAAIDSKWVSAPFELQEDTNADFDISAENNYIAEHVAVTGTKNWEDHKNTQGTRPDSLTLKLYRSRQADHKDAVHLATVTLNSTASATAALESGVVNVSGDITAVVNTTDSGKWTYTISNLDKYYSTTEPWYYRVEEVVPEHYTAGNNGQTGWVVATGTNANNALTVTDLTNSLKTNVKATKIWATLNAGVEVPTIEVALQVKDSATGDWKFASEYFTGNKQWDTSYAFTKTLTTGNTEANFRNLPKGYGKGDQYADYQYRVVETKIGDQTVKFDANGNYTTENGTSYVITSVVSEATTTITNTPVENKTTEFEVTKNWKDDSNNAFFTRGGSNSNSGSRAWSVTFELWRYQIDANNQKLADTDERVRNRKNTADITLTVNNTSTGGKASINDLAAKAPDGKTYVYYAKELNPNGSPVADNRYNGSYNVSADSANAVFTNELILTKLAVTKKWDNSHGNENAVLNFLPSDLAVELWQYSTAVPDRHITDWYTFAKQDSNNGGNGWISTTWSKDENTNQWTLTFDGLPKYDPAGNLYTYHVVELQLPGYLAPVHGDVTTESETLKQEITNTVTRFTIDKTPVNSDEKLHNVILTFQGGGYELIWSRNKTGDGSSYVEEYTIKHGGDVWSSGKKTNGSVQIIGLPVGTYTLVSESPIPEGYTNSAVGSQFELKSDGTITTTDPDYAVSGVGEQTVCYNLRVMNKPTELSLTKLGKGNAELEEGYLFSIEPAANNRFADGTAKKYIASGVSIPDDGEALAQADLIVNHTYILKEVQAPDYYLRSFGSVTFTLDSNGTIKTFTPAGADASGSGTLITFRNKPFEVVLEKTSSKDGSALKDAVFELQKQEASGWTTVKDNLKTDNDGKITLDSVTHEILLGEKYRLWETEATPGYELILDENGDSISAVEFTAKQNETTGALEIHQGEDVVENLTMTNAPIELEFVKMDMGDALNTEVVKAGVSFILEAVGNGDIPVQKDTTSAMGKLTFGPGDASNEKDHHFAVIGGQSYKLTETVPDGYEADQTTFEFTVTKDGKFDFDETETCETFTIENTRIPGKVELTKQDNRGNVMDGVVFTLRDRAGHAFQLETGKAYIASYTADILSISEDVGQNLEKTGKLAVTGLAWGTYTLEETVPSGYRTPGFSANFAVTADNAQTGVRLNVNSNVIVNTPVEVEVWKVDKDDPTHTPIPGAVYKLFKLGNGGETEITASTAHTGDSKLYNAQGNPVTFPMWTWDQNAGKGTAYRLLPGTYVLRETTVPEGFEQAEDFTFTVSADGTVTTAAPRADDVILACDTKIVFELVKRDAKTGVALDGVQFKVTCDGKDLGTKATHDGGRLVFGHTNTRPDFAVEAGKTYTVEEIKAANGYERITSTFSFRVRDDGTVEQAWEGNWKDSATGAEVTIDDAGLVITLTNTPIEIILLKQATGYGIRGEEPLGGVSFTLTGTVDGEEVTQTDTTVASGDDVGKLFLGPTSSGNSDNTFAVVSGVTYTLSETTPDGYADIAPLTFTVKEDGTLEFVGEQQPDNSTADTFTLVNERLPGNVRLTKKDAEGYTMNGVQFELYQGETLIDTLTPETGNIYQAEISDGELTLADTGDTIGTLEIQNLPWGDYKLVEKRPAGYQAESDYVHGFTIDALDAKVENQQKILLQEITVTNTPVKVQVRKTDAEDTEHKPLPGAEYALYRRNGTVDTLVTGGYGEEYTLYHPDGKPASVDLWNWDSDTGTGTAFRLEEGTYVLKEVTPPAGYETAGEITFRIGADGKMSSVSTGMEEGAILAKDTKIRFQLVKKDAVNGDPLDGVQFTLSGGGKDQTATTHDGGVLTFGYAGEADFAVSVGTEYVLTETAPIHGYQKMTDAFSFTVLEDGTVSPKQEGVWKDSKTGATITVEGEDLLITAANTREPGKIILVKTDKENKDYLNGVTFRLYRKVTDVGWLDKFLNFVTGKNYTLATTFTWDSAEQAGGISVSSGEDGTLTIDGLEWGTYKLEETNADGYVLDGGKITVLHNGKSEFAIGKGAEEALEYTFQVENIPNRIKLVKVDAQSGAQLLGETYSLMHYNRETGQKTALTAPASWEKKTGDEGTSDWYEGMRLPVGDYILEETKAPEGYEIAEPVIFTVNADGSITGVTGPDGSTTAALSGTTLTVKDEKIFFELVKWDGGDQFADSAVLKTAVSFTLTDSRGNSQRATTDTNGKLYFTAENAAHSFKVIGGETYTLTETVRQDNGKYSTTDGYYSIGSVKLLVGTDGTVSITQNVAQGYQGTVAVNANGLLIDVENARIPGTVTLKKLDKVTQEALDNVIFRLYRKVEGETWFDHFLNFLTGKQYEVVQDFRWSDARNEADETVDAAMELDVDENEGVLTIHGLPWGDYKLVEIRSDGYVITPEEDDRSYPFSIGAAAGTSQVLQLGNITNEPNALTVTKVAFEDGTKILSGAVYELYGPDGQKITDSRWNWDPAKGTGTATRLAPGEYTLKETRAPYGYTIARDLKFQIDKYGVVTMGSQPVEENAILAKDKLTKFTFTKKALIHETCAAYASDTRLLPGVTFTAYEDAALTKVLGTAISDDKGQVTFTGLPLKDYLGAGTSTPVYIRETATVAGHVLDTTVYKLYVESIVDETGDVVSRGSLEKSGTVLTDNTILNDVFRADFQFTKVNELDNSETIPGAVYGLYKTVTLSAGSISAQKEILVARSTADENGVVTFPGLLMNVDYTVRELSVPAGCYLSKNAVSFRYTWNEGAVLTLLDDGEDTVTVKNGKLLWQEPQVVVSILKVNGSKQPLAGATLQIRDWNGDVIPVVNRKGKLVESWVSTTDAFLVSGLLEAGQTYWLHELEAPSGYVKARRVKFEIPEEPVAPGEEQVVEVTMTNYRQSESPKTGDDIFFAGSVMTVSAAALVILLALKKKKALNH